MVAYTERIGPKIDPWGIPHVACAVEEMDGIKIFYLTDRKEENHFRAVPEIQTQSLSLLISVVWSMVSKAACPDSAVINKLFQKKSRLKL